MFERKKSAGKIYFLPIDQIHPSPFQARRTFEEQELAGLAQSIRENGLLQPISVRKAAEGYELVAGERRLRACKLAQITTIPASDALRHIETSGLPFLIHVNIIVTHVATEGAIVVVRNTEASSDADVAAAPLNPYQPSHRINTPSAPRVIECPGIALTLITFPALSFTYFPIRGPRKIAPTSAAIPPTMWIAQDPA